MFRIYILCLLAFTTQVEAASVSLWQWKNIRLRLEARGDERTFLYDKMPADFAARAGIAPGATFWEGQHTGNRLEGSGYLYGKGCASVTFNMAGDARINAKGEIVFTASPPKRVLDTCTLTTPQRLMTARIKLKLISTPTSFKDDE